MKGHKAGIYSLFYLEDDKISSLSFDNTIKIWDLQTFKCIETLRGNRISAPVKLKDNKMANVADKSDIQIWG